MPDRYSSQYREMVLAQVRAGTSVAEVAAGLEVSEATVYRWRHQDRVDRVEVTSTIIGSGSAGSPARDVTYPAGFLALRKLVG